MAHTAYTRSRREARYQGAWAFLDGEFFSKNNIHTGGEVIFSYGRHFPMALKCRPGIRVNEDTYSVTTSKHQSALRHVLRDAGYRPTDVETQYQGHSMRLWIQEYS